MIWNPLAFRVKHRRKLRHLPEETVRIALARLLSVVLPWVVAACSSPTGPSAPPLGSGSLVVSGLPTSVDTCAPATGTVTAITASGSLAIGYAGTVRFTSTDPAAQLPSSHKFVAADRGSYTFTVRFGTAGTQTVTATDVATSALTGGETVTVTTARCVSENVFAVGDDGSLLHYDGTSWTGQATGTFVNLFGVWAVRGATCSRSATSARSCTTTARAGPDRRVGRQALSLASGAVRGAT